MTLLYAVLRKIFKRKKQETLTYEQAKQIVCDYYRSVEDAFKEES